MTPTFIMGLPWERVFRNTFFYQKLWNFTLRDPSWPQLAKKTRFFRKTPPPPGTPRFARPQKNAVFWRFFRVFYRNLHFFFVFFTFFKIIGPGESLWVFTCFRVFRLYKKTRFFINFDVFFSLRTISRVQGFFLDFPCSRPFPPVSKKCQNLTKKQRFFSVFFVLGFGPKSTPESVL